MWEVIEKRYHLSNPNSKKFWRNWKVNLKLNICSRIKSYLKQDLQRLNLGVGKTKRSIMLILLLGFLAIAISGVAFAQKTHILGRWDMG
ncbi:MAG: hypothetical protein DRN03_01840, partial [Thermoplasmata archaeon]